MSSSNVVKEETHLKLRASNDNPPPISKSFESLAFADFIPSKPQRATYQAHVGDKMNAGSTVARFI